MKVWKTKGKAAKPAVIRRKVLDTIVKWAPLLGLEAWDVRVKFDEKEASATAMADPRYRMLICRFNIPRIVAEELTEEDVEELALHELVHAPLWNLSRGLERINPEPAVSYFEEETTTCITNALLGARAMGKKKTKKRRY